MKDTVEDIVLSEEEISELRIIIKRETAKLCKKELETLVNTSLDQVLADPGNPLLRMKASITAKVWQSRYGG